MKNQTCCFSGHRDIPQRKYVEIQKRLEAEIRKLIHHGIRYFGVGVALGFDTMAALGMLELKIEFPYIRLILVLPCRDQTKHWAEMDKKIYNQILMKSDKVVYTSAHYYDGCMHKRNQHLVDNSSYLICYLKKDSGGTKYTIDYAIKKGLKIIMLP